MLRSHSSWFASTAAIFIAAVFVGCTTVGPLVTLGPGVSPGASLPADVASGGLPTFAPGSSLGGVPTVAPGGVPTVAPGGKTPKPGKTPKGQPTTAPGDTTAPTTEPTIETPTTPPTTSWPTGAIAAADAGAHVGETLPVCGVVAGANWLFSKAGHPTWLNFGGAYPNQNFNAVIWGEQRRAWPLAGKPDVVYPGHEICVTGLIQTYKAWPQIQNVDMSAIMVIQ